MAIVLRDVLSKMQDVEITLLGGKEGLDNVVSWVHMVENIEISDFLKGGEITFTTGIGLGEGLDLMTLVREVYRRSASAMVINIGPYIQEIPSDVACFADENKFPIFIVPWHVHMAEMMRIISFDITNSERENMELEVAMRNAIVSPHQEELYLEQLSHKMFMPEWRYEVALIEIVTNKTGLLITDKKLESYKSTLQNMLIPLHKNSVVLRMRNRLVIVTGNYTPEKMRAAMKEIKQKLSCILAKGETAIYAIGGEARGIGRVHKSYKEATKILKLVRVLNAKDDMIFYEDLGYYKLLIAIEDQEVVEAYYKETIEPIVRYDSFNQTDLRSVLESYLRHSGSVKDTAEEMFIHRNTVNYKIKKIEELLQIDLSDLNNRIKLTMGLMLDNLYNE